MFLHQAKPKRIASTFVSLAILLHSLRTEQALPNGGVRKMNVLSEVFQNLIFGKQWLPPSKSSSRE